MTASFGGFALDTGAYKVQRTRGPFDEAEREMIGGEFARRAGGKLLATRYQTKTITIEGSVEAASIDALRTAWVALELALSKEAQQLKVHLDSTDRYYVATKRSLTPPNPTDANNRLFTFYTAVFDVPSPFALAAAPSNDLQADKDLSLVGGSEYKYAWTIPPGGTVFAEPVFTITVPATGMIVASYSETNADGDVAFGDAASQSRRSQGFKVSRNAAISRVSLWLKKYGAPTDNLTVEIHTDSGGLPSGTVVTNGTSAVVAGASLALAYGYINFDFVTPPVLTAATQYHIVIKRSGANDLANCYYWGIDSSSPTYADGTLGYYDGTWHAEAYDGAFKVYDAPPYGLTKLWIINNSLSPPWKLAVIKTFAAGDVVIIDCAALTATINAVTAANTEGAYPILDPRVTDNAIEVHAIATSPPTLTVETDATWRYLT
jgi:hypothetical protein